MEVLMDNAWAGIDAGKEFHWARVVGIEGKTLLSRKVENDEADLHKLIGEVLPLAEEITWATDQPGGTVALLLALLWERNQKVVYIPGLSVDRARDTYRGESKTDAQDAYVIAEQARMRGDFIRPEASILTSLPGMGPVLGAEFLVAAGDLSAFSSADQLAAYAGLVPAAHDSGKRTGNDHRMRGGNKVLKRAFYQSAFASLRTSPVSRAYYDRKRREGKRHTQAVIALARRRVNVLWAMLRDGTTYKAPSAA